MRMRHKLAAMPLIIFVAFATLVACGRHSRYVTVACASTATEYAAPSPSSGRSSSSPAKSSPAKAPSAQNRPSTRNATAKPPSAQHATAAANQAKSPGAQNTTDKAKAPGVQNKAKVTPPGEKAYKPPRADVRPPAKDYDRAAVAAPDRVTRGGSYRSPVTNHVYVFHDSLWYSSPGYRLDLFDPYNQWNYTNPLSPFFGRPYNLVNAC